MKHYLYFNISLIVFLCSTSIIGSEHKKGYISVTENKHDTQGLIERYGHQTNVTMTFHSNNDKCTVTYQDPNYSKEKTNNDSQQLAFLNSPISNIKANEGCFNKDTNLLRKSSNVKESNVQCVNAKNTPISVNKEWLDDIIKKSSSRDSVTSFILDNKEKMVGLMILHNDNKKQPIILKTLISSTSHDNTCNQEYVPTSGTEGELVKLLIDNATITWKTRNDSRVLTAHHDGFSVFAFVDNEKKRALIGKDLIGIPYDYYKKVKESAN
jgi:hypothetical protein